MKCSEFVDILNNNETKRGRILASSIYDGSITTSLVSVTGIVIDENEKLFLLNCMGQEVQKNIRYKLNGMKRGYDSFDNKTLISRIGTKYIDYDIGVLFFDPDVDLNDAYVFDYTDEQKENCIIENYQNIIYHGAYPTFNENTFTKTAIFETENLRW